MNRQCITEGCTKEKCGNSKLCSECRTKRLKAQHHQQYLRSKTRLNNHHITQAAPDRTCTWEGCTKQRTIGALSRFCPEHRTENDKKVAREWNKITNLRGKEERAKLKQQKRDPYYVKLVDEVRDIMRRERMQRENMKNFIPLDGVLEKS